MNATTSRSPRLLRFLAATFLIVAGANAQGIPNVELPSHVHAPEKQLTVYADYAARNSETVPLYVVNRTDKPVSFGSQDGDIFLELQFRLSDGTWRRAEVHMDSFCGNSYYGVNLPPGQHFIYRGYAPDSGQKARVRYSQNGEVGLTSNEGDGFVVPEVVEQALRDSFGRSVSSSLEQQLDLERRQHPAFLSPPEGRVAALRLMRAAGANPYFQEGAEALAKEWESKSPASPSEKAGAKAIREILAQPWPERRTFDGLFARCLEAIRAGPPARKVFGQPEQFPGLVWRVLWELQDQPGFQEPEKWKPVVAAALAKPTPENIRGVLTLAARPRIGDELLPSSFFEKHLFDDDDANCEMSARVLARRGGESFRLIDLGWKLPPKKLPIILRTLAENVPSSEDGRPAYRTPELPGESEFWKYCLKTEPLQSLSALRSTLGYSFDPITSNPFVGYVRSPLRDLLTAEIARSTKSTSDFELPSEDAQKLRGLVDFLASCQQPEDTPLLRDLLAYRGYDGNASMRSEDGSEIQLCQFRVREAAKEALLRRGEPTPADVILVKKIPRPKSG